MKDLIFRISLKNHILGIRTKHDMTVCSCSVEDRYKATLTFASKTYARVYYRNVELRGTVTKRNIWKIFLDMNLIAEKRGGGYRFLSTKFNQQKDSLELSDDGEIDENALCLYNQIITEMPEEYSCIEEKETFRYQLCEMLFEAYYGINNLDEVVDYERYLNDSDVEEPIVEKDAARRKFLQECKAIFDSFCRSEEESKKQKTIITLVSVVEEMPELAKVPRQFLEREFSAYLEKNEGNLISPDIYYCRADVLYGIGVELYQAYEYSVFIDSIEEKIDQILLDTDAESVDRSEIYRYFKTKYGKEKIPSDNEFREDVTRYINDCVAFCHLYNKFVDLFGTDCITLGWNDETIRLFQKYDENELDVDPKWSAEYEVYKYVIPYYKKHFFRKNSNKYKPVIEKLPEFIAYATSVLDTLFKHNILIDTEECVVYNEDGDFDSAYKEIEQLTTK